MTLYVCFARDSLGISVCVDNKADLSVGAPERFVKRRLRNYGHEGARGQPSWKSNRRETVSLGFIARLASRAADVGKVISDTAKDKWTSLREACCCEDSWRSRG